MATRLYITSVAAAYTPPTHRGTWTANSGGIAPKKLAGKEGSRVSIGSPVFPGSVTNQDREAARAITDPLPGDVTISGTVEWVLVGLWSGGAPAVKSKLHIFVTQGDSDTVRGTLLANTVGADNYTSTSTGFGDGPVALTTVTALAGDRICAELGFRATTTATSSTALLAGGGTDATDAGEGDTTANRSGWLEFSTDLFAPPAAPSWFFPYFR